jgi:hypothetical protein
MVRFKIDFAISFKLPHRSGYWVAQNLRIFGPIRVRPYYRIIRARISYRS